MPQNPYFSRRKARSRLLVCMHPTHLTSMAVGLSATCPSISCPRCFSCAISLANARSAAGHPSV